MANYRNIHCQFWRDPWIMDLTIPQRYLFIYFFSNEASSLCGLYALDKRIVLFETGMTEEELDRELAVFEAADKVYYRDGVVWVKNMQRYNALNMASKRVQEKIKSDVAKIPENHPCRIAYERHQADQEYDMDTLWIGYMQGIDTVPIPETPYTYTYTDTDSITDTVAVVVTGTAPREESAEAKNAAEADSAAQNNDDDNGNGDQVLKKPSPPAFKPPKDGDRREKGPPNGEIRAPPTDEEVGEVYRIWQMARGGMINPLDAEMIGDLIDTYSATWVTEAIHEANAANTRGIINLNFIDAILRRWAVDGFKAPRDPDKPNDDADKLRRQKEIADNVRRELRKEGLSEDQIQRAIEAKFGGGV